MVLLVCNMSFFRSWLGTGGRAINCETAIDENRQHRKYLEFPKMRIPTLKHFYFFQMVYPLALFFVKASILALYHRIFERAHFRYKIYGVAAFVTTYTIVAIFVNVS